MGRSKSFLGLITEQISVLVACAGSIPFVALGVPRPAIKHEPELRAPQADLHAMAGEALYGDMVRVGGDLQRALDKSLS